MNSSIIKINNTTLNNFRDFPSNFLDWFSQFSSQSFMPLKPKIQEAKKIYKANNNKEIGFIYRKYITKSVTIDNAWYDNHDFIPSINVECYSVGDPILFFGDIFEYKNLLNKLLVGDNSSVNLKNLYHFGKVYLFKDNLIKDPVDIF